MPTNYMKVKGKGINKPNTPLTINLADDFLEVRGFGKPVTREKAREMAEAYFKDIEAAESIVQEIDSNKDYAALKSKPEFNTLKALIDPACQTVSGVFGKEIILQILSMRNCEGIRYIVGKDQGKNTVIFIGVQEDGYVKDKTGKEIKALSTPVQLKFSSPLDIPLDGEVHQSSLNIADTRSLIGVNINLEANKEVNKDDLRNKKIDLLFGSY